MYSKDKKEQAITLRKEGYAYSHISKQLSIAKSTLSLWLQDIPFIPNGSTLASIANGQKKSREAVRVDKLMSLRKAEDYAKENVGVLSKRDKFLLGVGIYIGEGSKTGSLTRIVNSDPRIINFSITWLKECFGLKNENFRLRIHLYPDTNVENSIKFWMDHTQLPKESFHSCYVDVRVNKKNKKVGVLPHGTAHLSVVSNGQKDLGVLLQRKILATIDRVLSKVEVKP